MSFGLAAEISCVAENRMLGNIFVVAFTQPLGNISDHKRIGKTIGTPLWGARRLRRVPPNTTCTQVNAHSKSKVQFRDE